MPYPSLPESLGSLLRFEPSDNGVTGDTSLGRFRIQFFRESIVRVTVTRSDVFDDFSYAVVGIPAPVPLDITESPESIELRSSSLVVRISRSPVRLAFLTIEGQVINEDDSFGTSWIGEQVTTYKKLQEGERFIGLGEKTGPLNRRGAGYQNWNTDTFGYTTNRDPLYSTIPFYIGLHNRQAYGILFDNSHKTHFNFGASNNRFSSFSADQGDMDYYFFHGNTALEVVQLYSWLTGRMELPPLWSLGYQQCRYSYYPDKEVITTAREFRDKRIPADAMVLDIHYMEAYKIFTWNRKNFPDPKALLRELDAMDFNVVVMCDPGIKEEKGYPPYDEGMRENAFLKYPDGSAYTGEVWPGWCHFPDFSRPATRAWWARQMKAYSDLGIEGYWNDMNEIATWGQYLPENIVFDLEGRKGTTREGRNLYGFLMARSTYEGAKAHLKGKRPFNLTRAGYSGIQRYAAMWTGDNVAYDEHMMLGIRLVNSLGISGVAFAGYDVGGFVGDADTRLFARWITLGAFSPFFRVHTMINSRDSEPWSYGEEVEEISRNYIRLRYMLLPYLYSAFHEAAQDGTPVQRSLALDYSFTDKVYESAYQHQYFFGPAILVAPVESHQRFAKVYFPEGVWYSIHGSGRYEGESEAIVESPMHKLPVFIRAGAVIPMQPPVQSTREKVEELILHVYFGEEPYFFDFYEDDGSTFDYQEGYYLRRRISHHPGRRSLTLEKAEGNYTSSFRQMTFVFHGFPAMDSLKVGGNTVAVSRKLHTFFEPYEKFDPIEEAMRIDQEEVQYARALYVTDDVTVSW
jgi:alpha-glucosidase